MKVCTFQILKLATQFALLIASAGLAFARQFDSVTAFDSLDQTATFVVHNFVGFVSYWHSFTFNLGNT